MTDVTQTPYVIEKAIPLPERQHRTRKYPFDFMEVGDSFRVTAEEYESAQRAAYAYAHDKGLKFNCRKKADGTGRIWRMM